MKSKIIITGHDLGFSKSINEGYQYIFKHLPQVFSELSILPNSDYSQVAVTIAKESGISTNLCINFVNSKLKSLSGASSLLGVNGHLKNADTVNWDFSVIDGFTDSDIQNELDAQYQWYLTNFGHKPSALVSQKGEHGDPKILEPMIKLAKSEGIPMRAPLWRWRTNYGAQSLVESEGILTTGQIFIGLKDWQGNFGFDLEVDIDRLVNQIKTTSGISEVLLFVGFCDEELFNMTSVSWQRGQSLNIIKRKYHLIERLYQEFDVVNYSSLLHS